MAFDTLSDRLKLVAVSSLKFCRKQWGSTGLKTEEEIHGKIGWRPTFFMKPDPVLIKAVEVSDSLFPEILKGAAHDIAHYDFPVSVYQACSLDVFQRDPRMSRVNLLRDHGFGLITVDDAGNTVIQIQASPLAQYIPTERLEEAQSGLNPALKVKFNSAYATYQTNIGQGLQEAGQIVEALVDGIVRQAEAAGKVPAGTNGAAAAAKVDALYGSGTFHNYRAALGGARNFLREYRNLASHAPKNAKQAAEKIRNCRIGFFDAIKVASQLRDVCQKVGYIIRLS